MARLLVALALALSGLGALFAPSRGVAGACATGEAPTARLLGVPAIIASDGGLLVRAQRSLDGVNDPAFHVAPEGRLVLRSGHFVVAGREVAARVVPLGRGLGRVEPVERIEGAALFVTEQATRSLRFEARPLALSAAPTLTRASLRVRRMRPNGEDVDVNYRLDATLRRPPPAEARALLLYEGREEVAVVHTTLDASGDPPARRIEIAQGGSCDMFGWPFGWPRARASVSAAFVDDSGRLSPRSRRLRLR